MSHKKGKIWPADPHTLAKLAILENYLFPYFYMLGSTYSEKILYVDAFAGPGVYDNASGSPVAALVASSKVLSSSARLKTAGIVAAFIEKNKERYESLVGTVESFRKVDKLQILTANGEFEEEIAGLERMFPSSFKSSPAFFFIDPFGTKGVPFSLISRLLENPKSEILLNFNASGVSRIWSAGGSANMDHLDILYGDRECWEEVLNGQQSTASRERASLKLYVDRLKALPGVSFVYAYEMRNKSDRTSYFLIFASHHPAGLEKMKEVMKAINGQGTYVFSDAHDGQHEMFSANDPAFYADHLHERFAGTSVSFEGLAEFTLNETPFINPKQMLKVLEVAGKIEVVAKTPRKIKFTYNEDLGLTIIFNPYAQDLFN